MSELFSKSNFLGRKVKFKLNLSNYATKADLRNAAAVDISKFTEKVHYASLKSELGKLNIGKLEATTVDLSNLNDLVKN